MGYFNDIAKKYKLETEPSFGGFFGDIAEKFNLTMPFKELEKPTGFLGKAEKIGEEIREKVGRPLAEAIIATPEIQQERISKASKILNLPETILGGIATKITPEKGETLMEYLNRVPYLGDVVAERLKEKGLVDNPQALTAISMAIGFVIPNIPGGEAAKKKKLVEEFLPTGKIIKELEPLAQEARKFKSAEEFVNNKEVYYRGTTAPQTGEIKPVDTYGLAYGKGVYLASDARFAKDYGPNVSKYYVDWKNPFVMDKPVPNKIIDILNKDFPAEKMVGGKLEYGIKGEDVLGQLPLNENGINDYLKKLGFDGLKDASSGYNKQSIIFDTSILKTKSQLIDFYNQAVKGVSKLEEVKSPIVKPAVPIISKTLPTKIPQITYKQAEDIAEKLKRKDITFKEYENLNERVSWFKEMLENDPAKQLLKYVSRTTGELPEVTGQKTMLSLTGSGKKVKVSEFGQRGDQIVTELGFEDTKIAQDALDKYLKQKTFLDDLSTKLSNIRKEKSAIRRGEFLMQLAKGDRRLAYRAVRDTFDLTESELAGIRQGKDIMAMSKQKFDEFLRVAEGRAYQIAERTEALTQLKGTIYEKELKKWENLQQAMKLPKFSEMNIEQIKKFDDILSQYKTGDEFLPVRQIETIDNTVLKGIRTTREALEHLAGKYNLTPDKLPPIKPHPWMYDTQLARQHPLYDLLVNRYNESYLKSSGRIIELERKSDEFIKAARKTTFKGFFQKIKEFIAPIDRKIPKWLEGDEATRAILAKNMTPEELKAAQFQDSIYREYYDWLSKREIEKKFSSRFENKYFPHTRRGFLEAWREDGFLKAFKEQFDQFKQEERMLTILDEKTGNILPYQKWVGFSQYRTGKLIPTQNAARAFKTYITALEKARQFDEFIPEIMVYVHSLTPKGMTSRGIELNDSLNTFIKKWINAKKGRVEKQIITPGSKMDWTLRMGVALTRIRDLGLNIPVGIANIFGEQAGNLTMLGAKNYSLGVSRLVTSRGRAIIDKYPNFIGKTFWEKLTEASNTAGDKFLSGIFGLFGTASRKGNQIFLLGSMTPEEFIKGTISIERLGQLRKGMGKYRIVEGAESIFGKSVEGAIGGQYKKWSIPILVSTKDNAIKLAQIVRNKGIKAALSSEEGSQLFYSIGIGSALGLGLYGYYNELEEKKNRNFVEDIIYKSMRDAMSMIGALNPKFIGSFAAPRLATFIVDLSEAINNVLMLERYKTTGELKGVKQLEKILTPIAVKPFIEEKEKPVGVIKSMPSLKMEGLKMPSLKMPSFIQ